MVAVASGIEKHIVRFDTVAGLTLLGQRADTGRAVGCGVIRPQRGDDDPLRKLKGDLIVHRQRRPPDRPEEIGRQMVDPVEVDPEACGGKAGKHVVGDQHIRLLSAQPCGNLPPAAYRGGNKINECVFEKRPRCGSFNGDGCEIRLLEAVEIDKPLAGAAAADRHLDPTGAELLCNWDRPGGVTRPVTPVNDSDVFDHRDVVGLTTSEYISRP